MRNLTKKIIALFVCMLVVLSSSICVFAAEEYDMTVDTIEVTDYADILASGSYHTFYTISYGTHTGAYGITFTLDKACYLKFMQSSTYTNGQTGTLHYVLSGQSSSCSSVLVSGNTPMDGSGHAVTLNNNSVWTNKMPAGTYSLMFTPNNVTSKFSLVGEVYTLSY